MYAHSEITKGLDIVGEIVDAVWAIISQLNNQAYLHRLMNRLERDQ